MWICFFHAYFLWFMKFSIGGKIGHSMNWSHILPTMMCCQNRKYLILDKSSDCPKAQVGLLALMGLQHTSDVPSFSKKSPCSVFGSQIWKGDLCLALWRDHLNSPHLRISLKRLTINPILLGAASVEVN